MHGANAKWFRQNLWSKSKHFIPPAYEDGTECSETSAYIIQTPGNYPKENIIKSKHISCSKFFLVENPTVYEVMWKNMVAPDRPQMTIWRMRIACWILRRINIHSEYVIIIAFPLQQWLHESPSLLRYTYSACLVWIDSVKRICTAYLITLSLCLLNELYL